MQYKSNVFQQAAQQLLSGNYEQAPKMKFFRIPKSKSVKWAFEGKYGNFSKMSPTHFAILANAYNSNPHAREALEKDLQGKAVSFARRVELYTYYTAESLGLPTPGVSLRNLFRICT